jgi:hypothetical protein
MKPALMEFKGGPAAAADLFEDVINTSLKVAVEALAMEINPEVASRMIAQRVLGKAQQDG